MIPFSNAQSSELNLRKSRRVVSVQGMRIMPHKKTRHHARSRFWRQLINMKWYVTQEGTGNKRISDAIPSSTCTWFLHRAKKFYAVNCFEALNYFGSTVSTVQRERMHCNATYLRVNSISWLQLHCQYPFPQTGFSLVVSPFASRRN